MATPGNLSEQILAVPSGAGSVQSAGQTFQADPYSGTGRYAVPIETPAGPAGLTPALSLAYSTHAGQGSAGLGWSLGLASIQRRTDKGLPVYDDQQDSFALQGDELLHTGDNTYRQRIEGRFARIRHVKRGADDYWVVTERDGTRVFYGLSGEARLHAGNGRIAAWYASFKQDVHGNELHYRYQRDDVTRDVRLVEVTWAGCYRVVVDYEERPDRLVSHKTGFRHEDTHRVAQLEVQVRRSSDHSFTPTRRYALQYLTSAWTGRSLLQSVTVTGIDAAGATRTLPSLQFGYVTPDEADPRWHAATGHVPGDSLSRPDVSLVRQSGSGLPDILESRSTGQYLRVNLGGGQFARPVAVAAPGAVSLAQPGTFISDMTGHGFGDLVVGGGQRVYRAAPGGGWGDSYRSSQRPAVDLNDPSVRLADLTGDGLADLLQSTSGGWLYFPNEGDGRWGAAVRVLRSPPVRLDDPTVHLVDTSGDGLADVVQTLPTGITVWPGLGRGQFGDPVTLPGGPDLRQVAPQQLRWVDLTGSGQVDLLVQWDRSVDVYLNHSGRRLERYRTVRTRPMSSHGFVEPVDLLGTGAQGLLCTDRSAAGPAWHFLELFPGGSPDLLATIDNGLGARTTLAYTSSGAEWARDHGTAMAWATHMPSAQRIVQSVTTTDQTTQTTVAVSYAYHHGVYSGEEREFRGFALVEQVDREGPQDDPDALAQAKVVRFFHTGEELDLRRHFAATPRGALPPAVLPRVADARRALKGQSYREETYALDGNPRPYSISETQHQVFPLQRDPQTGRHSMAPLAVRTRTTHSERTPHLDHRVSESETTYDLHQGRLGYGLPVHQREIAFGRRGTFATTHEQQQTADLTRRTVTSYLSVDRPDDAAALDPAVPYVPRYLVGKPQRVQRYGGPAGSEELLGDEQLFYDGTAYEGLGYPGSGTQPGLTRGLLSCRLVLAVTDAQLAAAFPAGHSAGTALSARGHYYTESGAHWVHTERVAYASNGQPVGSKSPTGGVTVLTYDATYGLFPIASVDALGHPTTLARGELPHQVASVTDANDNVTAFTYDPSGMPLTKSAQGRYDNVTDTWSGDPPSHPTESYSYDFDQQPVSVTVRTRQVRLGATFDVVRYLDGLGRTVQERHTAEPDPATPSTPRYRVTGWQVYNHKGLVVRAYQPTFSDTDAYEPDRTNTAYLHTHYDPLGRPVRVDHPDGTFEQTSYHPWVQQAFDRNDTASHLTSGDARYGFAVSSGRLTSHLSTPTTTYVDAFGRNIAVAEDNGGGTVHITRTEYDLRDQPVAVYDARGLGFATWTFTYDLQGRRLVASHATAMGDRYSLPDAAGQPIWSRDARGITVDRTFDALARPLTETSDDGTTSKLRRAWAYAPYDDTSPDHDDYLERNVYGQVEEARDADGLRFFDYDHRGLVLVAHHRFWDVDWDNGSADVWTQGAAWDPAVTSTDRASVATWLALPGLDDTATLSIETDYDAAGRPTEVRYPTFDDAGTTRRLASRVTYNAAGQLATAEVKRGDGSGWTNVLQATEYNARGQLIAHTQGNGVVTTRTYDSELERLLRVFTELPGSPSVYLQDRRYTYDPVGNPLRIEDGLVGSQYKSNQLIDNTRTYTYDPRYRLVNATGRMHATVTDKSTNVVVPSPDDNDYDPYDIDYTYDPVGNLTKNEEYSPGSLHYKAGRVDLFNGDTTEAGSFTDPTLGNFTYDANGNTLSTPRQHEMAYTFDNQPRYVDMLGGGKVRYLRHADQRVVRLVKKSNVFGLTLYLGPFELHMREGTGGADTYTKLVLHVSGEQRLAQVEKVLAGSDSASLAVFFVHADHLGSGHVLTKADGTLLSQEEYFPYGRASDRRDARNRYRYIGVERDEDTGLCMTGPRTYDPVSGRFLQGDLLSDEQVDSSPFSYGEGRATLVIDPTGYAPSESQTESKGDSAPIKAVSVDPEEYENTPDPPSRFPSDDLPEALPLSTAFRSDFDRLTQGRWDRAREHGFAVYAEVETDPQTGSTLPGEMRGGSLYQGERQSIEGMDLSKGFDNDDILESSRAWIPIGFVHWHPERTTFSGPDLKNLLKPSLVHRPMLLGLYSGPAARETLTVIVRRQGSNGASRGQAALGQRILAKAQHLSTPEQAWVIRKVLGENAQVYSGSASADTLTAVQPEQPSGNRRLFRLLQQFGQ